MQLFLRYCSIDIDRVSFIKRSMYFTTVVPAPVKILKILPILPFSEGVKSSSSTSEVNSSSSNNNNCVVAKIHLLSDLLAKQTRELKASVKLETEADVSPQMIATCKELRKEMVALLRAQMSGESSYVSQTGKNQKIRGYLDVGL